MAELKTRPSSFPLSDFLETIESEQKRKDSFQLLEIMHRATGFEPKMWGDGMMGFGTYHYKYASGREGDWFLTGFSPPKTKPGHLSDVL